MTKEETKAYNAAYYAVNSEKILVQQAVYYAANREKFLVRQAAYRVNNPEKIKVGRTTHYAANSEKINAKHAAYRADNPDKIKAGQAAYRAANPGKNLVWNRLKKYGITPEAFQLMLLRQKNSCGICEEVFSEEPNVDHCHRTGEVRGLLCGRCNRALGGFRDSLEVLERAKEYLR